jgi:hypothetical protein
MAFFSGVGAFAKFTPTGGAQLTVANQNWNADYENRLAEVTNAGSGGNAQYIATVNDQSGSFDVIWDSTNRPEGQGIFAGASGTIVLFNGTSGFNDSQLIVIQKLTKKLDCKGGSAIMYSIAYKGNAAPTFA